MKRWSATWPRNRRPRRRLIRSEPTCSAATEVLLHELSPAYLAPLSNLLASTGELSVHQYALTIANRLAPTDLLKAHVGFPTAVVMSVVFLVAGTLVAIDLNTRQVLWRRMLGTARDNGPFGHGFGLPLPIGIPNPFLRRFRISGGRAPASAFFSNTFRRPRCNLKRVGSRSANASG